MRCYLPFVQALCCFECYHCFIAQFFAWSRALAASGFAFGSAFVCGSSWVAGFELKAAFGPLDWACAAFAAGSLAAGFAIIDVAPSC
jgi:hypothetical protein